MKRANKEQSSRPRARAASLACAALALFVGGAASAVTQQQTPPEPNIAKDLKDKKATGEGDTRPSATPVRKGQPKQPKSVPSYEVNFKTDIPEAEIFIAAGSSLSAQPLGKTDASGKLKKWLPRGIYNLLASRPGYRIQPQRVEVRSDGPNDVNFSLAMPAVAKKEEAEVAPEPTPMPAETPEPAPTDPLADADALIKRFLDVKETESVKAEEWRAMRERTNAALEKDPANTQLKARVLASDGQLAYLSGDFANALVAFKQSALTQPDFALAHYGLGNAYLATNQPAEAFRAYSQAVKLSPELALAYRGMCDALAKQNKAKEAAVYCTRAKSLGQQLPADTGLASARELKKRKRWAQALKEFQDVAATNPSSEVYVEIGDCYTGLEQPLSASQSYRKAIDLDPKSALAHYKFGEVMQKLREYPAAMEALERAIALDPQGTLINRKRAREMADDVADKLKKK